MKPNNLLLPLFSFSVLVNYGSAFLPSICGPRTMAVFMLEDALSVQTDNASMVVFIVRTHYPTGRTWANICTSSGYASQV